MIRQAIARAFALRVAALVLGCALALVAVEIILRALQLAPNSAIGSVTEIDFARYPGILTPGQDLIDRQNPILPFAVRINSLGYRGADFPARKPIGELRILAVGDSFTYGDFVNGDETLPAQFEARLRRQCRAVTVINAGIGGTTLLTHAEMIRRALPLELDAILLTFSENDVSDLASPMWPSLAENRRAKSRFPLSVLYPILRRTALWNFALKSRARLAARATPTVGARGSSQSPARLEWENETLLREEYEQRLRNIRDFTRKHQIPLVLALYPSHHSIRQHGPPVQMSWVERTGRSLEIPTVSFLEILRQSGHSMEALHFLPHDGHPRPLGYTLAADELLRRIDWPGLAEVTCRQRED